MGGKPSCLPSLTAILILDVVSPLRSATSIIASMGRVVLALRQLRDELPASRSVCSSPPSDSGIGSAKVSGHDIRKAGVSDY
jgi:hypothetical protein